jgi:hypothetical protein
MSFNQTFFGPPNEISPAGPQSPLLGIDVENDILYVNSGKGWVEVGASGSGVTSLNTLTGAVTLSAGGQIVLTPSGNNIQIGGPSVASGNAAITVTDTSNVFHVSGVPATTGSLGVVQPDGTTITVNGSGVISASSSGGGGLTQIAKHVSSTTEASITFSAIPGTFSNLLLVFQVAESGSAGQDFALQFNGDSGANYNWGFGANTGTGNVTNGDTSGHCGYQQNTNYPSSGKIDIPNYAGTVLQKGYVGQNVSESDGNLLTHGGMWNNTAAITSITLFPLGSLEFIAGTTFTLYGLQ